MKQKGNPKTGGRVKGTPNKVTKDVRQLLNDIVQSNIVNIENDLKKLTSKERLQIITGLLPYVVPKRTELEFSNDTPGITLNFSSTPLTQKDIEQIREIENGSIPIETWVNPNVEMRIN
jgi:hypothetical protein